MSRTGQRLPRLVLSVADMQAIDRTAIEVMGIPRLLLMEHAGRAVADAVERLVSPLAGAHIWVCCGSGYNGGDGLCAAWHLARRGCRVRVIMVGPVKNLREEPAIYGRILRSLHIPMEIIESEREAARLERRLARADGLVDALLGIGLQGMVRPVYAAVIEAMNASRRPVVAADVPSGLDADRGVPMGCAVRARVTVSFGAAKRGLVIGEGPSYAGRVIVDDLGIPAALLQRRRSATARTERNTSVR